MRNENANGAGTLLPATEQVNCKKAGAVSRAPKRPGSPRLPLPTSTTCPLSELASQALATLCRRYRVEPGAVVQGIVESFLSDACEDASLAPCAAKDARVITRTGKVPAAWTMGTTILTPGLQTGGKAR